MDQHVAEQFFSRVGQTRILVVGDLMLDEYIWGETCRISPEAPVQVVEVKDEDLRLGGAGNVIDNIVSLGGQVEVVGVLGDDDDGRLLMEKIASRGLSVAGVRLESGRQTSRKTRVLASNQQMLRIDRESRAPIGNDLEKELVDHIGQLAGQADAILVSDYQKGLLTESFLQAIIATGSLHGIPVLVDPKGDDYGKYRGATLLTPNRKEASQASGIEITDDASLLRAGRLLQETLSVEALLVTRSEEGMTLFRRGGGEVHLPTLAREVYDVSGAGDTVIAVLALALAAGAGLEPSAELANLAAGIVVGKVGTSTVSPQEIRDELSRRQPEGDRKILDVDAMQGVMAREHARNSTVVFTNGCFDLLHVGHVKYLQQARALGDLLVLGLNSDDSIRRLKGEKRPLICQEERAHLLAALDCIDYVVVFDEDTPLKLISALRPDILVKGGDYTPEGVVGRELVEGYGGRVELINFVDGKSTTNIINKILESYQD